VTSVDIDVCIKVKQHIFFCCNWFHLCETTKENVKYKIINRHIMRNFKLIMAMVVLICSVMLLFIRLFTPQTIQITLETGREITTESPEYYTIMQVILLVASAFLIGSTATYLYFESDIKTKVTSILSNGQGADSPILKMLNGDERRTVIMLQNAKGEMLQNRLVEKLGLSKVKVTRILARLEKKGLVVRTRQGLTNKVKLQ